MDEVELGIQEDLGFCHWEMDPKVLQGFPGSLQLLGDNGGTTWEHEEMIPTQVSMEGEDDLVCWSIPGGMQLRECQGGLGWCQTHFPLDSAPQERLRPQQLPSNQCRSLASLPNSILILSSVFFSGISLSLCRVIDWFHCCCYVDLF